MKIDKSLVSGSTAMLVLKLLEENDMYGYEMIEKLRERSENVFELKAGTLYPLLHGLEEKGCLKSYEKPAGGSCASITALRKPGRKFWREESRVGCLLESRGQRDEPGYGVREGEQL